MLMWQKTYNQSLWWTDMGAEPEQTQIVNNVELKTETKPRQYKDQINKLESQTPVQTDKYQVWVGGAWGDTERQETELNTENAGG